MVALAAGFGLLAGIDPRIALAAALGLAFVAVMISDLAAGLVVFTVVAFLDFLPFGGAAVTLSKVAGVLLVLSWLAVLATKQEKASDFFSDHPMASYLLLLFLGWSSASILWAEDPQAGIGAVYRYGLNILLFLVVYTAIPSAREAVWVVGAFLFGAFVSASYGIAFPAPPETPDDISRLGGVGVGANEVAALLVAALALAGAFAAGWRRSPLLRLASLVVLATCTLGVLLSFSRGGLIALAVALVAAVVLGGRWRPAAVGFLVVVSLAAVSYITFFAPPEARERVTEVEGGTGRTDIWKVGLRMVEASPTNGIGAGNFATTSVHYLLEPGALQRDEFIVDEPKVAHNIYLEVLAELGVVGLVLFLGILGFSLAAGVKAARAFERVGDRRMELLARSISVALIALLAADFFVSDQFSKQLWLLLALGPTLLRIAETEERAAVA